MLRSIILLLFLCSNCWAHDGLEDGIRLFHEKKYEQALSVFQAYEDQKLGSLVGQLYCNVALGRLEQIDPTIHLIDLKLQDYIDCTTPPSKEVLTQQQHQKSYQCRQHVREVTNQIRQTVEKLVRETVDGIFLKIKVLRQLYPYIDALERTGLDCCQNNFPWQCCTNPLIEQLEAWNSFGITSDEH